MSVESASVAPGKFRCHSRQTASQVISHRLHTFTKFTQRGERKGVEKIAKIMDGCRSLKGLGWWLKIGLCGRART